MKSNTTLSRWRMLASVPAAAALAIPTATGALNGFPAGPDAELLELGRKLAPLVAEANAARAADRVDMATNWQPWVLRRKVNTRATTSIGRTAICQANRDFLHDGTRNATAAGMTCTASCSPFWQTFSPFNRQRWKDLPYKFSRSSPRTTMSLMMRIPIARNSLTVCRRSFVTSAGSQGCRFRLNSLAFALPGSAQSPGGVGRKSGT
jgi:hypothetical protein